jgi:RecA-family ATPase
MGEPMARALADDSYGTPLSGQASGSASADVLGELHSVADMAGVEPEPQRWLIDQMLPVGAVTTLFGDGGVGKTLMAMQMGVAIDRGRSFFGHASAQAPVMGIFCEDTKDELDRRFHAISRVAGIDQASVISFRFQSRFGQESLLGRFSDKGEFAPSKLLDAIRQRALDTGARFVILDNILHLYSGNINDPGEVTRFMAALNRLALEIDGAVLLIGHIAKTVGSEFSGTMAWSNASRSRLFFGRPGDLTKNDDEPPESSPDARFLARLKANYAPISEPMELLWREGAFVRLDDLPPNVSDEIAAISRANVENDRFLECLDALTKQLRHVSHSANASNYAPKVMAGMTAAKGMKAKAFAKAMERLFHIGAILPQQKLWAGADRHPVLGIMRTDGMREGAGRSLGNPQESLREGL